MDTILNRLSERIRTAPFSLTALAKLLDISYQLLSKYVVDMQYGDMKLSTFIKLYVLAEVLDRHTLTLPEVEIAYKTKLTSISFEGLTIECEQLSKIEPLLYEVLTLIMRIGSVGSDASTGTLGEIKDVLTSGLNDEEYTVINERIKPKPKTLQEIGDELGITKQRVEQVEKLALQKLKSNPSVIKFITSQAMLRRDLEETTNKLNKLRTEMGRSNEDESNCPVASLGINDKRLRDYFVENKIFTVGDLLRNFSVAKIMDTRNMGMTSIQKLQEILRSRGFRQLREF